MQHEAASPMDFRRPDQRQAGRGIATQCVHAGEGVSPGDARGSGTPVYYSTTYRYETMQDLDDIFQRKRAGYVYSRYGCPTNTALEQALATMEQTDFAMSCASGMAACHLALVGAGLAAGDLVLASADIYGATHLLIGDLLPRLGLRALSADFGDLGLLEEILRRERPRAVFFEVMTNPLIRVIDAPAVMEMTHRYGAIAIVDNTFTTPLLLRPAEIGADWIVHSLTKFLAGHGDVLAGAVLGREENFDALYSAMLQTGPTLGPHEAYLALRGLKTFHLRFERHCANAMQIARFLEAHPLVERVHYPGLESHAGHGLARELFGGRGFGAVIGFEVANGDRAHAFRLLEALRLVLPATTLGDVYSTMMYPAHSSHAGLSDEELRRVGISQSLLRVSVGIEDVEDLCEDLDAALRQAAT